MPGAARTPPQRSLKARALQFLAQREHSRAELRRKLLVHARALAQRAARDEASALPAPAPDPAEAAEAAAAGAAAAEAEGGGHTADPRAEVEATLDWLEAHNYLSQARFVESRVHARASRYGNLRIQQELKQHAVALAPEAAQALRASELDRARAVWARKFGGPAADGADDGEPRRGAPPAERAKQARFLAGRGFSPEVIRAVLRGQATDADADEPADAGAD